MTSGSRRSLPNQVVSAMEGKPMTFSGVVAQATVSDLEPALRWYSRVFGRQPDDRPMDGLAEWHLARGAGVQVWAEPDRAGRSSLIVEVSDLDALISRIDEAGITHDPPQDVTASRILTLEDPDGNRLVLSELFDVQISQEDVARAFSSHRFEEVLDRLADDVTWVLPGESPSRDARRSSTPAGGRRGSSPAPRPHGSDSSAPPVKTWSPSTRLPATRGRTGPSSCRRVTSTSSRMTRSARSRPTPSKWTSRWTPRPTKRSPQLRGHPPNTSAGARGCRAGR